MGRSPSRRRGPGVREHGRDGTMRRRASDESVLCAGGCAYNVQRLGCQQFIVSDTQAASRPDHPAHNRRSAAARRGGERGERKGAGRTWLGALVSSAAFSSPSPPLFSADTNTPSSALHCPDPDVDQARRVCVCVRVPPAQAGPASPSPPSSYPTSAAATPPDAPPTTIHTHGRAPSV